MSNYKYTHVEEAKQPDSQKKQNIEPSQVQGKYLMAVQVTNVRHGVSWSLSLSQLAYWPEAQ